MSIFLKKNGIITTCLVLVLFVSYSQSVADNALELSPEDRQVIESFEEGISLLASKSKKAARLEEFYFNNRVLMETMKEDFSGEPKFRIIEPSDGLLWFGIAVAKDAYDYSRYMRTYSIATAHERYMIVRNEPCTALIRGLVFAHELDHILSYLRGAEKLSNNLPEEAYQMMWCAGEADAHTFQRTILNEYTNGEYESALKEQFADLKAKMEKLGKDVDSVFVFDWVDIPRLEKHLNFPATFSDLEKMFRTTMYGIDAELLRVETTYSHDQDLIALKKIEFMHKFYEKEGALPHYK